MASADMPVERTMFVRKATGLVKGWSVFDAFIYSALSINLITLGFGYAFTGIAVLPESALIAAVVLSALFIVFEVLVYASLVAVMPRAGGDYVWQSRVLGGGAAFLLAVTGWWFILWYWAPVYAKILNVELFQPLAAISCPPWLEPTSSVHQHVVLDLQLLGVEVDDRGLERALLVCAPRVDRKGLAQLHPTLALVDVPV